MKVLFYYSIKTYQWQGKVYMLDTFMPYVAELGKQAERVTVLAAMRHEEPADKFNEFDVPENVELVEIPWFATMMDGYRQRAQFKQVVAGLKQQYDRVVIRYPEPNWKPVFRLAQRQKVPCTIHFVGNSVELNRAIMRNSSGKKKLVHWLKMTAMKLDRWLLQRTIKDRARLVSNGSEIPNHYFAQYKDQFEIVVSSSLSESDFLEGERTYFKNDRLNVLFVGFLRNEKGIDYLLRAFEAMPAGQIQLHMVGSGDSLEAFRTRYQSNDGITFHGFQNKTNIHSLMDDCDVLILPSLSEGTPRVLLEAMSRKLFVVGTRVGGIPDVIGRDQQYGMLIEPGSASAIQQAFEHILNHREETIEKIRHSFEYAKRNTAGAFISKLIG